MPIFLPRIIEWLLLLPLIINQSPADAARSLSARRVRGASSRTSTDRYDRSITTFDPEGRLLQLEYALTAAEERGRGLTVCVEWNGNVIFAFPSSTDSDIVDCLQLASPESKLLFDTVTENNPTHNSKIHRLSPTHLLLTSGLAGDARTLASAFRRVLSSWTHLYYGEVITTRELAAEVGKVRHRIGLRPGARVLGVIGLLIGLDDNDERNDNSSNKKRVMVRMYRSLPGGTIDRCNVSCTGGGADADGNLARKEAIEMLSNIVSDCPSDAEPQTEDFELQRIVEKVTEVALKYHPNAETKSKNDTEDKLHTSTKVDIWIIRASASHKSEETNKCSFVSPHRSLGKSSIMTIKYARRVSPTQLTSAARSLFATPPK